ncbi:MAG: toxic anion resistance protein [Oscillospiraceae bacterium]|nr:toxic anion resistance protein [Oscillospiraceae bacterium]
MAESEYTPTLTLNPTEAAVQEAPAAPQVTLQVEEKKPEVEPEKLDIERLSPNEQAAVREFAKQIDVTDTNLVLSYGAAAQKNISEFSGQALGKVRTKDMGEVGNMLSSLVVELKGLNEDEKPKGIMGLFKKAEKNIAATKAKFDKAEVNVDKITQQLQQHQVVLSQDITAMDKMFELNQAYFKELTMYIIAGKLRAQQLRENELVELQKKAEKTGLPEDAQAANDFANLIGRFEKKLHDLELTRMISLQMGPQIRMIQNNDLLMTEKIQTAIVNTIPLWKQQMVLALSMYHSQQAMEASHAVSEVTNDLLQHNAEALHTGSVEVAKESERGIVDLETLKKTNQHLIDTLEEVRKIQDDGRARRAEAEAEFGRIEGELKRKLLEMKG